MRVWTLDTEHFTLDDNSGHTWDGWHNDEDAAGSSSEKGAKRRYRRDRYNVNQLRHEDELILKMIKRFMAMQ